MKRTLFFLGAFALSFSGLQADELFLGKKNIFNKAMDSFGQSRVIQWCEKKLSSDAFVKVFFGAEPASPLFQEMGKDAQITLGISEDCHVPIYKMTLNLELFKEVGAFALPGFIIVNENRLNRASYGAQRAALFHEAVHIKYADSTASEFFVTFFLALGVAGSNKIIRDYNLFQTSLLARVATPFAVGMTSLILSGKFYGHYRERRADIEGCYATQCYVCVKEHAEHRRKIFEQEKNSLRHNGYLWAEDLLVIADELKRENRVCIYHSEIVKG